VDEEVHAVHERAPGAGGGERLGVGEPARAPPRHHRVERGQPARGDRREAVDLLALAGVLARERAAGREARRDRRVQQARALAGTAGRR
jgi:hypothetical protein